jgi:arabinose-5-phosphate isomerase
MNKQKYAKEILLKEARAIEDVSNFLSDSFDHTLSAICEMPIGGRVIVSGMGKAGFIAMKFSATLASVGIQSFFLHPAEAIHGDLGRFSKNDIAFIMSNSGETPEILKMLPHIKRIGCVLISMTSSKDSNLAKHSDVVLEIGKSQEAGPLGLAPTTSTTVMLALSDAIAMSLIEHSGFSSQDFAKYHPGGDLGRSLTLVSEIMRTGDSNCIVKKDTKTREVIHKITITKGKPGAACVVDENGKLYGIFTDGNLRRCLEEHADFLDHPISDFTSRNPKVIKANKLAQEALRIMSDHKIDQLIVVNDNNDILGLLDIQDLVGY